jgi:hypothetical protein
MTVRVPDTNTFSLWDVFTAVQDHASPSADLSDCFAKSYIDYFDPDYNDDSYALVNSMKRFRNYGPCICLIDAISYVSRFFVDDKDSLPRDLTFSYDGYRMHVLGDSNNKVYDYVLGTAWDITSASYVGYVDLTSGGDYNGMFLSEDGYYMYLVNGSNIEEWKLGYPWQVYSASHLYTKSVSAQDTYPAGIWFSPDGTKMYIGGNQYYGGTKGRIYQYNLSTAWYVPSAEYYDHLVYTSPVTITHLFGKSDGSRLFHGALSQINLSTLFDINTAFVCCEGSFPSGGGGEFMNPVCSGLWFSEDLSKVFTIDINTQKIGRFST